MARRYKNPACVNTLPSGNPCNHEMQPLGERHPLVGKLTSLTNPRRPIAGTHEPGVWAFRCGYCNAIQAADTDKLHRYYEKV